MNPQQPNEYPQAPIEPTPPQPYAPQPPVVPTVQPEVPQQPPVYETPQPVQQPVYQAVPPAQPPVFSATPPEQQPVFGGQPPVATAPGVVPPQAFGTGPGYPPQAPKSKNKLIALIGIIVGGLVLLGGGIWLAISLLGSSVALETYEGDGYSILAPKDYTKDEASTSVTFEEPDEDSDTQSKVSVASYSIESTLKYTTKDKLIEMYDKTLSEENLSESGLTSDSDNTIDNFKKETTTHQDFDARKISFDVKKDGKKVGEGHMLIVFGDDSIYMVSVAAHAGDPGLQKAASKILDSLKIDK